MRSVVVANSLFRNVMTPLKRSFSDDGKRQLYDRILRVDYVGERAAYNIYAGQMAVLGNTSSAKIIQHMWEQEKVHLDTFKELVGKYRARPTIMMPVWDVTSYALGIGSALLGKEGAMACTAAVEDVIVDHYDNQIRELMSTGNSEQHEELLHLIKRFRDEELEHHDTGIANEAEKAPFYSALTAVIKLGCRGAIWISEKI